MSNVDPPPGRYPGLHQKGCTAAAACPSCTADLPWLTAQERDELKKLNQIHRPDQLPFVRVLPPGTVPLKFVGEGAANVVFEIHVPGDETTSPCMQGKLLRIAKVTEETFNYDYISQYYFHCNYIQTILHGQTVQQELAIIRDTRLVNDLNKFLSSMDHLRKKKFRGSWVGRSDWAFLLEDMRPDPSKAVLVEFKPKWLSQSPSAPIQAVRCRQCALHLQEFLDSPSKETRDECQKKPCPLALAREPGATRQSPFRVAPQLETKTPKDHFRKALTNLVNHPALHGLRQLQRLFDREGPLKADLCGIEFGVAMTLRDCTCFAHIPLNGTPVAKNIRFGDLDWKDPSAKAKRWKKTEKRLVDGGFYTADCIVLQGVCYRPPTACALDENTRTKTPTTAIHIEDRNCQNGNSDHNSIPYANVFHGVSDTTALQQSFGPSDVLIQKVVTPEA